MSTASERRSAHVTRERAKAALGDKFSLREFHNVILNLGMVPLTLLEQEVDAYIRSKA